MLGKRSPGKSIDISRRSTWQKRRPTYRTKSVPIYGPDGEVVGTRKVRRRVKVEDVGALSYYKSLMGARPVPDSKLYGRRVGKTGKSEWLARQSDTVGALEYYRSILGKRPAGKSEKLKRLGGRMVPEEVQTGLSYWREMLGKPIPRGKTEKKELLGERMGREEVQTGLGYWREMLGEDLGPSTGRSDWESRLGPSRLGPYVGPETGASEWRALLGEDVVTGLRDWQEVAGESITSGRSVYSDRYGHRMKGAYQHFAEIGGPPLVPPRDVDDLEMMGADLLGESILGEHIRGDWAEESYEGERDELLPSRRKEMQLRAAGRITGQQEEWVWDPRQGKFTGGKFPERPGMERDEEPPRYIEPPRAEAVEIEDVPEYEQLPSPRRVRERVTRRALRPDFTGSRAEARESAMRLQAGLAGLIGEGKREVRELGISPGAIRETARARKREFEARRVARSMLKESGMTRRQMLTGEGRRMIAEGAEQMLSEPGALAEAKRERKQLQRLKKLEKKIEKEKLAEAGRQKVFGEPKPGLRKKIKAAVKKAAVTPILEPMPVGAPRRKKKKKPDIETMKRADKPPKKPPKEESLESFMKRHGVESKKPPRKPSRKRQRPISPEEQKKAAKYMKAKGKEAWVPIGQQRLAPSKKKKKAEQTTFTVSPKARKADWAKAKKGKFKTVHVKPGSKNNKNRK